MLEGEKGLPKRTTGSQPMCDFCFGPVSHIGLFFSFFLNWFGDFKSDLKFQSTIFNDWKMVNSTTKIMTQLSTLNFL